MDKSGAVMKIVPYVVKAVVVLVLLVPLGWFIFQLLCWFFSAANYKNDLKPIVLTNELSVVVNGKEVKLPSGLVLYPLNDLECCPEVNDGREYKIYVDSSLLQSRELEGIETSGAPDLIYRIENNGR